MEKVGFLRSPELFRKSVLAFATVLATTILLLAIGRDKLGETVIALLFVVPVGWSTSQWGQVPGVVAAVTAALAFDFFFIPPFYTFNVGSLEGWLVLIIFLIVSLVVVGHIQVNLAKAQTSEHEAIFMYEMSSALANTHTAEAIAHTVARFIQLRYLPELVAVTVYPNGASKEIRVNEPQTGTANGQPAAIIPILNNWGLVCEVRVWRGGVTIPSSESRLFKNLALQIGQALERVRLTESGK
jgi:two-component system sensor histidine kinase KdpD